MPSPVNVQISMTHEQNRFVLNLLCTCAHKLITQFSITWKYYSWHTVWSPKVQGDKHMACFTLASQHYMFCVISHVLCTNGLQKRSSHLVRTEGWRNNSSGRVNWQLIWHCNKYLQKCRGMEQKLCRSDKLIYENCKFPAKNVLPYDLVLWHGLLCLGMIAQTVTNWLSYSLDSCVLIYRWQFSV